ncbi:MAG: hypothetical protein EXQ70_08705 [Solirubrobacterales bacterium]|nr:hypothetical protein [Solirubrobacterales bacterium]
MNGNSMPRWGALVATAVAAAAMPALPAISAAKDSNSDKLPDRWEHKHGLSLKLKQTNKDQDTDGLCNIGEFKAGTNPRDADSDNDGVEARRTPARSPASTARRS